MSDVDDVTAANAEFYAAIESGDVGRIEVLWDDADDVACVAPWLAARARAVESAAIVGRDYGEHCLHPVLPDRS